MDPVVTTPEVELQPPASKGPFWLIATLVLVVLAGAGTLWYVNNAKQDDAPIAVTPTPVTITDETISFSTTSSELADALTEIDKDIAAITTDSKTTDDDAPTL